MSGKTYALSTSMFKRPQFRITNTLLFLLFTCAVVHGRLQSQVDGGHILFGDLTVDESKVDGLKPLSFDLSLYTEGGTLVARQTVPNNGRYRFLGLPNGLYDLIVEVEGREVARLRVELHSSFKTDFRRDIELEWRPVSVEKKSVKQNSLSAADFYRRSAVNQKRFDRAKQATDGKRYDQAVIQLREIVDSDPQDFQAWTEIGTVHVMRNEAAEAEKAYRRAIAERPTFTLAFVNLGRVLLAQTRYEEAVEPLTRAVELQPTSADANFYLGEAYLQLKKGSKAVPYLSEAVRLGRHDAHLRLALLYNGAGMKDKAAAEYEAFLKKRPDYADRRKLEKYIAENKKP